MKTDYDLTPWELNVRPDNMKCVSVPQETS